MPCEYLNPINPAIKYQVVKTKKMKMIYSQQFNRSSRVGPMQSFVGSKNKIYGKRDSSLVNNNIKSDQCIP